MSPTSRAAPPSPPPPLLLPPRVDPSSLKVMKHLTAFRCQVVKLFAKHLKLEEQKVMLKKGIFPLAVRDERDREQAVSIGEKNETERVCLHRT